MKLTDREILTICIVGGVVATAIYFIHNTSSGLQQAETDIGQGAQDAGSGIGTGAEIGISAAGVGVGTGAVLWLGSDVWTALIAAIFAL